MVVLVRAAGHRRRLGYAEVSYAKERNLPIISVKNGAGLALIVLGPGLRRRVRRPLV